MEFAAQKRVQRHAFRLSQLPLIAAAIFCLASSGTAQETPYIGEIQMFAGNFPPTGWMFCKGQLLQISSYTALYALIGTTFGGDGVQTFGLPNLQSRIPIGYGAGAGLSTYIAGETGGSESETMSQAQLPAHTHTIPGLSADSAAASTDQPKGALPSRNPAAIPVFGSAANTTLNAAAATLSTTGGGQAIPTRPPTQCVSFIIATTGVFPAHQ